MIRIFGDVHGMFCSFKEAVATTPPDYEIVQIGDFGIWPKLIAEDEKRGHKLEFDRPVYFIDGNHEHFDHIPLDADEPVELYPNLFYVPRGTLLELDGRNILFIGGAESIDKAWRIDRVSWFSEETIRLKDVNKAREHLGKKVHMMITHAPPYSTVLQLLGGQEQRAEWNWSSKVIEQVWNEFNKPLIVSGHFHVNKRFENSIVVNEYEYIDI